jgi:hypothetical protein
VPKGTKKRLDWNADPASEGYYTITSVDYQANESTGVAASATTPEPPGGLRILSSNF